MVEPQPPQAPQPIRSSAHIITRSLRVKAFGLILLITIILSYFAILVTYGVYDNTMNNQYLTMAQRLACTEAFSMGGVRGDSLNKIGVEVRAIYDQWCLEHGGPPDQKKMTEDELIEYLLRYEHLYDKDDWVQLQTTLIRLAFVNEAKYMYITLWDAKSGTMIFLMDASSETGTNQTPIGWVNPFDPANLEVVRASEYDVYDIEPMITKDPQDGWLVTATFPIENTAGDVVAHAYVDISMDEVKAKVSRFMFNIVLMLLVLTTGLMIVSLWLVNRILVSPIKSLSRAAAQFMSISSRHKGTIFSHLNIRSKDEVGQLGRAMEKMEKEINDYIDNIQQITADRERAGAELNIATQIQADMLPSIFPAFPYNSEFDIYATMNPAKEVGGDFYDFFKVDDSHLAMVMADVSGKGVPAALFMVIAKTLIKNRAQVGGSPSEILHDVNEQLCEGNKAQLFVTVWLAILDISTGKGVAANAGHEDPVIRRANGDFELVKYRHSPVVAAMEGVRFREHEFELQPGDTLFVYTDGVPEATNADCELYGTNRMLRVLNRHQGQPLQAILTAVKDDIDAFVGDAPQFDDITMLGFDYYGQGGVTMKELRLQATPESLNEVNAFVESFLEEIDCPPKASMQLMVALEELYVNIANYAYAPNTGDAVVRVAHDAITHLVTIDLVDWGIPFNPLSKEDPDVSLSAEERSIGGLGIFMVKKSMDIFTYQRKDDQNLVRIGKTI